MTLPNKFDTHEHDAISHGYWVCAAQENLLHARIANNEIIRDTYLNFARSSARLAREYHKRMVEGR